MRCRLAVVIPYYQRERGILRRAVASALAQDTAEAFAIIVADDGSPVPARLELEGLPESRSGRIRILERPNGGPAAARNAALDHVEPGTEYVAFLDSDDEWRPSHLGNALRALDQGFDFYFANARHSNQARNTFELRGMRLERHERLSRDGPLYRHLGDLSEDILHNLVGTPTVVYRFAALSAHRFPGGLYSAGEDTYFSLALARDVANAAFSTEVEAIYGTGVNVFYGSRAGTDGASQRIYSQMRARKMILRDFTLTPARVDIERRHIRENRTEFIEDLLHRLYNGKPLDRQLLWSFFRMDPAALARLPPVALRLGLRKLAS